MFAFANFGTPHQQQREYNQSDRRDHGANPYPVCAFKIKAQDLNLLKNHKKR